MGLCKHQPTERTRCSRFPKLFWAICLYAIWCTGSDSREAQQAAGVEFYFYLPQFALRCPDPAYRRFIRELITNMPMAEIEKMGGGLKPSDLKRFLARCSASRR